MPKSFHVVVDTNIILRGLINMRSAARRVVRACDSRLVILLLSKPVLAEYRAVLTDRALVQRHSELTKKKVELTLKRLAYVSDMLRPVDVDFNYPRDPKDERFIELAIAGHATHIISADQDLLSLRHGYGTSAKQFRQRAPTTRIVDAITFLTELDALNQT